MPFLSNVDLLDLRTQHLLRPDPGADRVGRVPEKAVVGLLRRQDAPKGHARG